MKQHKWHKEIKAWADGAEIEQIYTYANSIFDCWEQVKYPCWYEDDAQFRIKPQPKEPQYLYAYKVNSKIVELYDELQMCLCWDGKMLLGKIRLESDDD